MLPGTVGDAQPQAGRVQRLLGRLIYCFAGWCNPKGSPASRHPLVSPFDARAALIMRIIRRHGNHIRESCAQPLDRPDRGNVLRIAGDGHGGIQSADKWRDGAAGVPGMTVTAKFFQNLVTNVPGANKHVRSVPHAQIDVTHFRACGIKNLEMIGRNPLPLRVGRQEPHIAEFDTAVREMRWRSRKILD